MDLGVEDFENSQNLDYGKTFLREFVEKFLLVTLTLGISCLIAAFRKDRKALHDLIFNTKVIETD